MNQVTDVASVLALLDPEEENLAHHAPKLSVSDEELERIARVAYRISQVSAERERKVLPPGVVLKPWRQMSDRERVEACATINRVLQALLLLGWIEQP